jgi:hypothetical protein
VASATTPEDYTQVTFPYDTLLGGDTKARLLATDGRLVIGCTVYGEGERESFGQALSWNADGTFGQEGRSYPTMDLPPPPARAAEMVAVVDDELAAARDRLAKYPDAPAEWLDRDKSTIAQLEARRARLLGIAA